MRVPLALAGLMLAAQTAHATPPSLSAPDLAGEYEVMGSSSIVSITPLYGSFFRTECLAEGWQGVMSIDREAAIGVIRSNPSEQTSKPGAAIGRQTIDCSDLERWIVTTSYESGRRSQVTWKRLATHASVLPPPVDSVDADHPPFGQSFEVDELPRIVTQTEPIYPDKARKAKTQGTVIVHMVVRRDGTTGDARVVRSVPGLDDAALATVRQWRFKPALAHGKPVAMWVAMPVRFVLPKK